MNISIFRITCTGYLARPFLKIEERPTFFNCFHLQLSEGLCVQF